MNDLLRHPWIRVLVIATTVLVCSMALREIGSLVVPVLSAIGDVLVPVAIGFALAYIVMPVVDVLGRLGLGRKAAAGLLFGVGSVVLVVAMAFLVPAVARQVTNLTVELVQGEDYVDTNGNGRYDLGEPFTDNNGNGLRDGPLLGRLASWAEESQDRLRVSLGLGLNDQGMAFLELYQKDTSDLRTLVDSFIAAGREGRPHQNWPALPADLPEASNDSKWSPEWPGLSPNEAEQAAAYVPESDRPEWWHSLRRLGMALHQRHADWLTALRHAKTSGATNDDPRIQQILDAWKIRLPADRRQAVASFALSLETQARAGAVAPKVLLGELGASLESSTGLSSMVDDLEHSVRTAASDLPGKLGSWAKEGITGWGWVMTWALNLILIPIYAFFLLLAMPKIRSFIKEYLPTKQKSQIIRITRDIEAAVAAFFRGRLIICTLCALCGMIGFFIIGLFGVHVPYGVLFGLGIGLATAVPLMGLLFLVPALGLCLLQPGAGMVDLLAISGVYGLVQGLEMTLIPVIMGRKVELHPVTLIIALLLCGKLLGIIGLVLAVPIAASLRILAREYFWPRLKVWIDTGRWETPPGTGVSGRIS